MKSLFGKTDLKWYKGLDASRQQFMEEAPTNGKALVAFRCDGEREADACDNVTFRICDEMALQGVRG